MAAVVSAAQNQRPPCPQVSVVMSVFNGEKYLHEAMDSILRQTFTQFEYVIIDDGSTDGTARIIQSYRDPRIVLVSRENRGLVASLNEAILSASGAYVARQDADDVSHLDRLQKQSDFLQQNPRCVAVGSWFEEFCQDGFSRTNRTPLTDSLIRARLVWGTCFGHGSVMFKRQAAIEAGLYRAEMWPAEDYDLWTRLAPLGSMANLPNVLYRYRVHEGSISEQHNSQQQRLAKEISLVNASRYRWNNPGQLSDDVRSIAEAGPEYREEVIDELKREVLRLRSYPEVRRAFLSYLRSLRLKTWLRTRWRLLTSFWSSSA